MEATIARAARQTGSSGDDPVHCSHSDSFAFPYLVCLSSSLSGPFLPIFLCRVCDLHLNHLDVSVSSRSLYPPTYRNSVYVPMPSSSMYSISSCLTRFGEHGSCSPCSRNNLLPPNTRSPELTTSSVSISVVFLLRVFPFPFQTPLATAFRLPF